MPTLYRQKGSPNWYFSHTDQNGKRVRPSTGTADKKAAQEYADTFAARSWRQEKLGETYVSFAAACLKWVKAEPRGRSDLANVRTLREWIGDDAELSGITSESLPDDLAKKSPSTRRRYINTLSAICRASGHDPKIKRPSAGQGRIRWLTKKEWKLLRAKLSSIAPHLLSIANFAIFTGLRMSNILSLEWSQCNLKQSTLWIHADQSKSGKPISVPLSKDALKVLKAQRGQNDKWVFPYLGGDPITRVSNHGWKSACKAAGLEDITFHDLRRTWASWHLMNKTPMEVVVKLGGWANSAVVEKHYGHLSESHIKQYANNARAK